MPKETLNKTEKNSKDLVNTHKNKFLRPIEDLVKDIRNSSLKKKLGDKTLTVIDPKNF